jgi:hypothetical protein
MASETAVQQAAPVGKTPRDLTSTSTGASGIGALLGSRFAQRRAKRLDSLTRAIVIVGAALQLANLVQRSWTQWKAFALTVDFATFHQAWWTLGHANLDPFDTLGGHPFWSDQFNLTFWPVGLLYPVSHSGFTLLVVQDALIAGATLVAGLWVCDAVEARLGRAPGRPLAIVAGTMTALVLDPWALETAYFDFHAEAIAAFFLLLAGRALWRGRRHSPFVWGLLAMASCTAGATLAVGLGLGALATSKHRRKPGLALALLGIAFIDLVVALKANRGTLLGPTFGYVAAGKPVGNNLSGAVAVATGVAQHPSVPIHMLWTKRWYLDPIFTAGGVLGVLSGWGAGVAVLDVIGEGLNASPSFVSIESGGFQNYPVVPFLVVGTALIVVWLVARQAPILRLVGRRSLNVLGCVLGSVALASAVLLANQRDPSIAPSWLTVPPGSAAILQRIYDRVPASWEVVASQGIVGRFAQRRYVYAFGEAGAPIPLETAKVMFVMAPIVGIETVPEPAALAAENALESTYHGTVTVHRDGVLGIVVDRSAVPGHVVELPPPSAGRT